MRRRLEVYGGLLLFGALVWGTADEFRHRPLWAQLVMLAFWTFVASVGVVLVAEDVAEKRVDEERREWDVQVASDDQGKQPPADEG